MQAIIYHNPKCTKSRQTLELLKANGVHPVVVEYLKNTPSIETLTKVVKALGGNPRDIIRTKEDEYKASGIDNPALSNEEIIKLLVENPILIERPIVLIGEKAVIGRPPENIFDII